MFSTIFLSSLPRLAFLALIVLVAGCQRAPPPVAHPATPAQAGPRELQYNMDLMGGDSIHPGARALRERAKYKAIRRMAHVKEFETKGTWFGQPVKSLDDPISEQFGKGKLLTYPNWTAYKRSVQQEVDSLKILEGIPLTH